jgi:hypothetical protein
MQAQRIEQKSEGRRHAEAAGALFQPIQPRSQIGFVGLRS